jgi:hypothetical protein
MEANCPSRNAAPLRVAMRTATVPDDGVRFNNAQPWFVFDSAPPLFDSQNGQE